MTITRIHFRVTQMIDGTWAVERWAYAGLATRGAIVAVYPTRGEAQHEMCRLAIADATEALCPARLVAAQN